jgi:hypothetical protein
MALAYSTICTVARTGTGSCARVAAVAPPPTVEPQAAGAREEIDEFADARTERGAWHACPSRAARVSAHRPPTRAAATPERRVVRGWPSRGASLHAAIRRPSAGRSASIASCALALALFASSRGVARARRPGRAQARPPYGASSRSCGVRARSRRIRQSAIVRYGVEAPGRLESNLARPRGHLRVYMRGASARWTRMTVLDRSAAAHEQARRVLVLGNAPAEADRGTDERAAQERPIAVARLPATSCRERRY